MRTTQAANLTVDINPTDAQGKSPMPKYLKAATISFELSKRDGVADSTFEYTSAQSESFLLETEGVDNSRNTSLTER